MSYLKPRQGEALTPGEERVCAYVGAGYTDKAAADFLGVSRVTVTTLAQRAQKKIGARSRLELALHFHGIDLDRNRAALAAGRAKQHSKEHSNG